MAISVNVLLSYLKNDCVVVFLLRQLFVMAILLYAFVRIYSKELIYCDIGYFIVGVSQ